VSFRLRQNSYVYLALSRSLEQGYFNFIDIPKNLPGIIFISATTTAAAQFITVARGPKGAGEQNPGYADFVSSGGVVVAERFQFFVWTILGCLVFLFLVFSTPPSHIADPPKVPDGFLQLMGISSLGYLAGKLARKPGPIIDEIAAKVVKTDLNLAIKGRILSPDATFKLAYQTVSSNNPSGGLQETEIDLPRARLVVTPEDADEQTKPETTFKKLNLTIVNHQPEWLRGKPTLTISNPDGQAASWPFAGTPEINHIDVISATQDALILKLSGRNLPLDAKFQIDGTDVTDMQLPLTHIKAETMDDLWNPPRFARVLDLEIEKPASGWTLGKHSLTLTSASGLAANCDF
jgi:hypothetical protein